MQKYLQFYIDGRWVDPVEPKLLDVKNPATDETIAQIALGSAKDVDVAVAAARARVRDVLAHERARSAWRCSSASWRPIRSATTSSRAPSRKEMGAPIWLSKAAQAATGLGHFSTALALLKDFEFEEQRGTTADREGADRRGAA